MKSLISLKISSIAPIRSRIAKIALGILLVFGSCDAVVAQTKEWTSRDGKKMKAELVAFNLDNKKILFRKEDQKIYPLGFDNLSVSSKLAALTDPNFTQSCQDSGYELPKPALLAYVGCFLFLSVLGMVFLSLPAVVVTTKICVFGAEFRDNLKCWLQLSLISLFVFGVSLAGNLMTSVLPGGNGFIRLLFGPLLSLASILAQVFIIKRSFNLAWAHASFYYFIYVLISFVLTLIVIFIFVVIGFLLAVTFPDFYHWLIDFSILKPLNFV